MESATAACLAAKSAANESTLAVSAATELSDRVRSLAAARNVSEIIFSKFSEVSAASQTAGSTFVALRADLRQMSVSK